ncbi:hypothetical protein D3C78_1677370 [compost metagenome]
MSGCAFSNSAIIVLHFALASVCQVLSFNVTFSAAGSLFPPASGASVAPALFVFAFPPQAANDNAIDEIISTDNNFFFI